MKSPLNILHLEDDPSDALLVRSILTAGGIVYAITCVQTRADFVAALKRGNIDLILSDYSLPSFDGLSAVAIARAEWPDLPVILVSGALGEELAIDSLKNGATDYVLKDRIARLVPAVRRAMQEVEKRAQLKLAEAKRAEYSRKLQALSRRLVETQERESRHLARELHDEIGQALTVAQINLQALMQSPGPKPRAIRLKRSLEAVDRVLEQVDGISLNLHPSILDDLGLEPALRWFTERQAALAGLQARFHAEPLGRRLNQVVETGCFRVAQGALTNVMRHAKAKKVMVDLRKEDRHLHLRVVDDGAGFDVTVAREQAMRGASLGLLSMEERAALAGGGLEFKSAPKRGAEVHAWFPLKWRGTARGSKNL